MHGFRLRPDSSALELTVRLYNRDRAAADLPVVGERGCPGRRRLPVVLPPRRRVRGRPCPAGDHRVPGGGPALLRRRLPGPGRRHPPGGRRHGGRRRPARLVPQHPGPDLLHGAGHRRRTSSAGTTTPPASGSCMWPTTRLAVGKKQWTWGNAPFGHAWDAQPLRRRRALRRADGGGLHRQPARLLLPRARGDQGLHAVLVPDPRARPGGPRDARTPRSRCAARTGSLTSVSPSPDRCAISGSRSAPTASRLVDGVGRPRSRSPVRGRPPGTGRCRPADRHRDPRCPHAGQLDRARGGRPRPPSRSPRPSRRCRTRSRPSRSWRWSATHLELYRHATRVTGAVLARGAAPRPRARRQPRRARRTGLPQRRSPGGRRAAGPRRRPPDPAHTPTRATPRALYLLGLVREAQGDDDGAYEALRQRASWMRLWRAPAGYRMARIDAPSGRATPTPWPARGRAAGPSPSTCRRWRSPCCATAGSRPRRAARRARRAGSGCWPRSRARPARRLARDTWTARPPATDAQTCLDVAIELAEAGEHDAALRVPRPGGGARGPSGPLGQTAAGRCSATTAPHVLARLGRGPEADAERGTRRAPSTGPAAFPCGWPTPRCSGARPSPTRPTPRRGRCSVTGPTPSGATTRRGAVAGERASSTPADAVVQRNLGLAAANDDRRPGRGGERATSGRCAAPRRRAAAVRARPARGAAGRAPRERLERLEDPPWPRAAPRRPRRSSICTCSSATAARTQALATLRPRRFQPWEGGEGQVLRGLGPGAEHAGAVVAGDRPMPRPRSGTCGRRSTPPPTLGEARHPLASTAHLHLLLGDALSAAGDARCRRCRLGTTRRRSAATSWG